MMFGIIKYFMRREISIRNPRYQPYELILEKILPKIT